MDVLCFSAYCHSASTRVVSLHVEKCLLVCGVSLAEIDWICLPMCNAGFEMGREFGSTLLADGPFEELGRFQLDQLFVGLFWWHLFHFVHFALDL